MANKRIWPVYILLTLPLVSNECPLVQHSLLRSDTFIFYYYYYYYFFFFFFNECFIQQGRCITVKELTVKLCSK